MLEQLTQHFVRREFACKCGCGFDTIDAATLEIIENVRVHFDTPVIINSAARCPDHNRAVGGTSNSQHLYGRAADIRVTGVDPADVHEFIDTTYPDASLGLYSTFVHVDTRTNGPARWER